MKSVISVGYICEFKEQPAGNQVIGLPDYLAKIVHTGENPFREFLAQVQPGGRINVQITIEALPALKLPDLSLWPK